MPFFAPLFVFIIVIALASIRIIKEYERGICYTLGQYTSTKRQGVQLVIPLLQSMSIIDIRIRTESIPPQDIISRDNVSVKVNAVLYYRVVDPAFAVNRVEDF